MVMLAIHLTQPSFYGNVIHDPLIRYGFAGLFVMDVPSATWS